MGRFCHRLDAGLRRFPGPQFRQRTRVSGNVGYQFSPDVETRFYFNANEVRQRIPGGVTKESALTNPEAAAPANVVNDWQRNIDTVRLANKTTIRFDDTKLEFGAFGVDRHLMHPIFQWLDYSYKDYGGFAKVTDDRFIGGFRNRFVAGVNILNGTIDDQQFANRRRIEGRPAVVLDDRRKTLRSMWRTASTSFRTSPRSPARNFSSRCAIGRIVFSLTATNRADAFSLWTPKAGMLWHVDPTWQVFGNISRSAEVPSFGESLAPGIPFIPFSCIQPQTATTFEIGTRMKRPDYAWEFTFYRANIRNELQCLFSAFGNCNVTNADRTIHQGIEAGAGAAIFRGIFNNGPAPDKIWLNLPTRSTTSASTTMELSATIFCPVSRATISAPSCCTRIRWASISGPMSNGCRRPISSTVRIR